MFANLENFNDDIFFEYHGDKISFAEWAQKVYQASEWLKTFNLKENSLVLLNIQDPFDFLVLSFACLTQKVIPCYLNSFYKEAQIESLRSENHYDLLIDEKIFSLANLAKISSFSYAPIKIPLDAKMIFYSSGSVQSKACVLKLENFFYNAMGSFENIPFQSGDKWGASLPLFHVGGFSIFVRALLKQGTAHWIDKEISLLEQIQKYKLTHLSLVSTQFIRLIEEIKTASAKLPSLKYLLLGGSSMTSHHIEEGLKMGLPILKSYGMTEMGSQICTTGILKAPSDSSGYVLPYRELKIENHNISVRGPCLFLGYMNKNQIQRPFDKEGWFSTNDLGKIKDNEIFITGRKDRIFQSGGENISPEQIEKEILKIRGVEKVYILPEADSEYGMRAIAYLEKTKELALEDLEKILKKKLSLFWRPKEFRPWDLLPKKSWKL